MKKLLFITSRNIVNTSGELRLIKNRTKVLYEKYGISTEFIVICDKKKLSVKGESIGYNSTVHSIGYSKSNPFSYMFSTMRVRKLITKLMLENSYDAIVVSGPIAVIWSKLIYRNNDNRLMVLDIHGALEEFIEFKAKNKLVNLFRYIVFKFFKYLERKNTKYFDAVFVVSKALEQYLVTEYKLEKHRSYIIPCSVDTNANNFLKNCENRAKYRESYGINDDELLFIYSGGISPWQCIEESVELFHEIQKRLRNKKCKMLILSFGIEKIRHLQVNESIIMDSIPSYMVKDVLCAGDFAFLLRENYITNRVAFPNKFLEYVNSGMKIIATPYVSDVASMIEEYDLGTIIRDVDGCSPELIEYVNNGYEYGEDFEKRDKLISSLSFETTLKQFVEDLKNNM